MTKKDKKTEKPKKEKIDKQTSTISNEKLTVIEKMAAELLKLMGTSAQAQVFEDKENQAVVVNIETTEEAGLLIGSRGRALNAIQRILGMMYRQKAGGWQRILVNVAGWREKEKSRLEQLARRTAERAKSTGEPQLLYNLTDFQRRTVHLVLVKDEEVKTESYGEGKDRYLVVRPSK